MVALSSLAGAGWQFFNSNGVPLAGGKLYTYAAGTTTPAVTYASSAGISTNTNPIILDSAGRPSQQVWLVSGNRYKFTLKNSANVEIWTKDNIPGINTSTITSVTDFGAIGNDATDDTAAIQNAVATCYALGANLYWPAGSYITTASIPNFHSVRHFGPGVVVRGSDNFHIENDNTLVNNLYVAVAGNDTNDGLSASQPFATLQHAIDVLQNYTLTGSWVINLAAGDYSTASNRTARLGNDYWNSTYASSTAYTQDGIVSDNFITIQGPDVGYNPSSNPYPVPTAIFQGGGAAASGIEVRFASVIIKNIKFREYNGSTSSCGVTGASANIRTVNVHTAYCYIGLSNTEGNLEVQGGLIYGNPTKTNTTGIRSLFHNRQAIGNQGAAGAGQGPLISFCTTGALLQESATGHFDSCSIEDCITGLRVTVNSRVNYSYTNFKRNGTAIRCDFSSNIFASDTAVFNTNTADANGENIIKQSFATNVDSDIYSNGGLATDYLTAPYTLTGTLVSIAILSKTLDQGVYAPILSSVRKPQEIKFRAYGTLSGTAGAKQFKLRMGSTILASVTNAASDDGNWCCEGNVTFLSPTSQTSMINYMSHLENVRVDVDDGTENMNAASKTLTFEVQLTNAADTVVVKSAVFEVWG
jgi:hypothetical protein